MRPTPVCFRWRTDISCASKGLPLRRPPLELHSSGSGSGDGGNGSSRPPRDQRAGSRQNRAKLNDSQLASLPARAQHGSQAAAKVSAYPKAAQSRRTKRARASCRFTRSLVSSAAARNCNLNCRSLWSRQRSSGSLSDLAAVAARCRAMFVHWRPNERANTC